MNAITTYLNAINASINDRIALSKAHAEFVKAYAKMSGEEQKEARNAIASLVSKRTGVPTITGEKGANKGQLTFPRKHHKGGNDKTEAAYAMFKYYLPKHIVEKSSPIRHSVDPVAKLVKEFSSLTAAQKRAFLKLI